MYRRLPVEVVECEKDLYDFMVTHPDTMVNIWEVMDISKMTLQEIRPRQFFLEDQAGTQGKIEYLYQSDDLLLIYVFGTYEGVPFPQKVKGCGLLILQNEQIQGPSGENQMAIRLDAFMQIQNDGVEALVKTFQPLVGKVADTNLNQIVLFLGRLSLTVKENGIGVARLAQNLERVSPEVRNEFAEVAIRGSNRQIQTAALPMPLQYQTSESVTVSNPQVGTEISETEMYQE